MARVEISEVVQKSVGATLAAVPGASVQVNVRDGAAATVYSAATGATTVANPVPTDSAGRIEGWLDEGSYDLVVSGAGLTTYTERFEAVKSMSGTQAGTLVAPTQTELWRFQPRDPDKAPFTWVIGGASFNGTWDTVMYLGYNTAGSGRVDADEPSFRWCIEQDYEQAEGDHWLESYFEYIHTDGTGRRPIFIRIDRDDGIMVGFDIRSNGVNFMKWSDDTVFTVLDINGLTFTRRNDRSPTITLGAGTGQTSVFLMEYGAATAFSIIPASASATAMSVNGQPTLRVFDRSVSVFINDNSQAFGVQSWNGGDAISTRDGPSGQSGNHYEAASADGNTIYSRFDASGYFKTRKASAPSDASLANNELALWVDTNGDLKIKSKTSGGTVKTATVTVA